MKTEYVLTLNNPLADLERVGGKGASLTRMVNAGLPVPDGFHVTTDAYRAFIEANQLGERIAAEMQGLDPSDPGSLESVSASIRAGFEAGTIPSQVASEIVDAYAQLAGEDPAVAVRSTATAEDLPQASFAGQQDSYLNVSGASSVLEAVRKCWSSLWTARAIAYRAEKSIGPEGVFMGVVVQLLVPAEGAGVLFTANPLNGNEQELVINASWGLGEAVVGGLVTPDTIVVDKQSGRLLSQETADKRRMISRGAAGTIEQAVPEGQRRVPLLDEDGIAELTRLGIEIEALYGMPMDIEWALCDGAISILQARPITSLPIPTGTGPLEWKLPKGSYAAMRNNIVELMTEPLSPLFSTLGLQAANASLNQMLFAFFGRVGIVPEKPIIAVNHYAYYDGSVRPGAMIWLFFDAIGIARRMFTKPVERWTETGRPRYLATIAQWKATAWRDAPNLALLDGIRALSKAAVDAYGSLVSGVIPAAWITEAIFTLTYNRLIKRKDDPAAPLFLLGFDSTPILAEKSVFDLAQWVRGQSDLGAAVNKTPSEKLAEIMLGSREPDDLSIEGWGELVTRLQAHMDRYGHMIYNLDFSNPVPADDPVPTLDTLKMFVGGEGADPYDRQRRSAEKREQITLAMQARLKGWRLKILRAALANAQRFAPLREDGIAEVGLAYPLLRKMLRELGRRFAQAGMIDTADDIFWLLEGEAVEAATLLDAGDALKSCASQIKIRKAEIKLAREWSPPIMLPTRILGLDIAALKEGRRRSMDGEVLRGVAASPGRVEAPACVLSSPKEFSRMRTGDVFVASLTTPAWTPLFARASAVVTDIGGPLSHGSIVAREYGIPSVLGTGSATSQIRSGEMIAVDGGEGKVQVLARRGD